MYNKTLAELRDIARELAQDEGVAFADVFDPMMDAMTKAKAKYGARVPRVRAATASTRTATGTW